MKADAPVPVRPRLEEWLPMLELAAHEVFAIVLGSPLRAATKVESEPSAQEQFTAMVGLAGSLRGVVTFCCGALSANQIAARMLGSEAACSEAQVWDAIG